MDHMGRCEEDSNQDETPDQTCERVRRSGRCSYNRTTCSHRVQPEEGCCPVCGKCVSEAALCVVSVCVGVCVCVGGWGRKEAALCVVSVKLFSDYVMLM